MWLAAWPKNGKRINKGDERNIHWRRETVNTWSFFFSELVLTDTPIREIWNTSDRHLLKSATHSLPALAVTYPCGWSLGLVAKLLTLLQWLLTAPRVIYDCSLRFYVLSCSHYSSWHSLNNMNLKIEIVEDGKINRNIYTSICLFCVSIFIRGSRYITSRKIAC